jgi:hypothetical protein
MHHNVPVYRIQSGVLFARSPKFIIISSKCKFASLSTERISHLVSHLMIIGNIGASVIQCNLVYEK